MGLWDTVRRTGQRRAQAFLLAQLPGSEGGHELRPGVDYLRVWLCEMFLARRSTLLAEWLPAAHTRVSMTRKDRPTAEFSRVLRPDLRTTTGGVVQLNHPITELVPYDGGVVEVEAALVGLQTGSRLDIVVDLLDVVSTLPVPALDAGISVARSVSGAVQKLVQETDGAVHLDLHQGWTSSTAPVGATSDGSVLRSGYLVALLATEDQVDPGRLRVVDERLHRVNADGTPAGHLLGWDFLLLRIEARSARDDFWLPDLQEQLDKAVDALGEGLPDLAERYRTAAVAAAWKSPAFTWADRDRVVTAVHARFDAVAGRGRGASGPLPPRDLDALVRDYGPDLDEVLALGPMTPEQAFAGGRGR